MVLPITHRDNVVGKGEDGSLLSSPSPSTSAEPEAIEGVKSPLRRCIVTGAVGTKDHMIRFVSGPSGEIVPDIEGILPGRGYWIQSSSAILSKAIRTKVFQKAMKKSVNVDSDLIALTEGLLKKRCLNWLGLCRRSGHVLFGFDKVSLALKAEKVAAIIAAFDGGEDGRQKIKNLAVKHPVIECFDSGDLGSVCGRDRVIHGALLVSPTGEKFLTDVKRYIDFTQASPGVSATGAPLLSYTKQA